jgi:hypothetical protein
MTSKELCQTATDSLVQGNVAGVVAAGQLFSLPARLPCTMGGLDSASLRPAPKACSRRSSQSRVPAAMKKVIDFSGPPEVP